MPFRLLFFFFSFFFAWRFFVFSHGVFSSFGRAITPGEINEMTQTSHNRRAIFQRCDCIPGYNKKIKRSMQF